MPELPQMLAGTMSRLFGKPVSVIATSCPAAQFKRVRFQGPALIGAPVAPNTVVEFHVDPRSFRHYTPAAVDPERGSLDVLFHLHGRGPGSAWAEGLAVGDTASLLGPGSGKLRVDPESAAHLLLGDETCLGLAEWLGAQLEGFHAYLEADTDCAEAAASSTRILPRDGRERGDALVAWLEANPPDPGAALYLSGHAQTIQRLRQVLKAQKFPPRQLRVEPYWADNKRGL
ncbi:siderophore-interacting protein [Pseudenhygromyxa sp. WMMC2535]|uniref:siderophore-interacting protein n=1 Tax=Pseudenhygromyxa sp. WMMC2535 TaxID=2712867 RepID=UPI00155701B7|nr:siderophore-interacting protein [Pseudenhygromyxa sp. WMMC2535]NVB42003.1 siderophore-interacting protein [Pseudenhygromyxa sp. WMMC2535]